MELEEGWGGGCLTACPLTLIRGSPDLRCAPFYLVQSQGESQIHPAGWPCFPCHGLGPSAELSLQASPPHRLCLQLHFGFGMYKWSPSSVGNETALPTHLPPTPNSPPWKSSGERQLPASGQGIRPWGLAQPFTLVSAHLSVKWRVVGPWKSSFTSEILGSLDSEVLSIHWDGFHIWVRMWTLKWQE